MAARSFLYFAALLAATAVAAPPGRPLCRGDPHPLDDDRSPDDRRCQRGRRRRNARLRPGSWRHDVPLQPRGGPSAGNKGPVA
ncbi:hypothetical protein PG999_014091 [Apiospora kogelbergensis]|uniref:Uncharacterized protein n=1 Tax=Apiospora kogelbergensis TaxID=1337665 RepID=A0AAW0Q6F0_9PEZI